MLSLQEIDNIVLNGGIVVDPAGEKIGSVEQVFTSGDSGDAVFVTVRTGLFGMSESFAPLSGASLEESVIRVAFAKETVKNAPRIDSDRGSITETQEQELYSYYGLDAVRSNEGSATAAADKTGPTQTTADADGQEGRFEGARVRLEGQMPSPSTPHGGPTPLRPHLHKHVPPHLRPGPHPPHRPPVPPPGHGPGQ